MRRRKEQGDTLIQGIALFIEEIAVGRVPCGRQFAEDALRGKKRIEDLDAGLFAQYLCTAGMPDPDLLIRTSGEMRISNFLLWQLSYAELYFTQKYWPDFRRADFEEALSEYQRRERRFGAV